MKKPAPIVAPVTGSSVHATVTNISKASAKVSGSKAKPAKSLASSQYARVVLAALDKTMMHGGRDEEGDRDHEQRKAGSFEHARRVRKVDKQFLEDTVELKAEQNLRTENQKTVVVERKFQFFLQVHDDRQRLTRGRPISE